MMADENVVMVKSVYDAFERGETQLLVDVLAEDVDWGTPVALSPLGGHFVGRKQVEAALQLLAEHLEMHDFGIDQMVAQDDTVIALGHEGATVKSTSKTYEVKWAHVFKVRAGETTRFYEYVDTAPVVEALQA